MWAPRRFIWSGRQRASHVAMHHPSVHPALESLEERLNLSDLLSSIVLPPPPGAIGEQTAGSLSTTLTSAPTPLVTMVGVTQPAAQAADPALVDFSNGFANSANQLTYNGSAVLSGNNAQLTNAASYYVAGSVFTKSPVNIASFQNQFTFQLTAGTNPMADGITFTIEGIGPTALGGVGGDLGYVGIPQSVAIKFDLYNNTVEGIDSTGLFTDGAAPTVPAIDLTSTGINLHSGDVFQVNMTYDGATLTVIIKDTNTGASATQQYSIDIPGTIGSNMAYVGFTGSTGYFTAEQHIQTWSMQSAGKSARITVTPTPAELQTSSSPQQIILHANAQEFSTGQPVTEGKIALTIYEGSDSSSPVIGQTSAVPVDSQGNVEASFTIPANTPPGTYMILAHYTDQGGSYSNSDGSAYLTLQPANPVIPPPNPPAPVPPKEPPSRTGPTSSPTSPSETTSLTLLPKNTVLTSVSLQSASPVLNFTGIGASLNPLSGPSSAFAITANMPVTQILAGYAVPAFLSPWFSEPTASPSVTSVVLDVPPMPFLPLGLGRSTTTSLAMESQTEGEMPSLSDVTTTALRLGTSLSDADDSAELFYTLAHKGTEANQAASGIQTEMPDASQIGSTSEVSGQPASTGDGGQ